MWQLGLAHSSSPEILSPDAIVLIVPAVSSLFRVVWGIFPASHRTRCSAALCLLPTDNEWLMVYHELVINPEKLWVVNTGLPAWDDTWWLYWVSVFPRHTSLRKFGRLHKSHNKICDKSLQSLVLNMEFNVMKISENKKGHLKTSI